MPLSENAEYRCRHCDKPFIGSAALKSSRCDDCQGAGHTLDFNCWACRVAVEAKRKVESGEIVVMKLDPDPPKKAA